MRRLWKLSVIMLVLSALTPSAFAIFGLGDIVFDPSNYAEAIQQLLQMEQQYAQLVQTYQMVRSQYDHLVWMARRVPVVWRSATKRRPLPGAMRQPQTPTAQRKAGSLGSTRA